MKTCTDHPLAGGGFCDVHRGLMNDGGKVAIKSLRIYQHSQIGGDSESQKLLKRAAREVCHWSKLKHPNVLSLLGLAVFKGHVSMVSGWMENGSLSSYLRLNPGADGIKLCMDICAGLCYTHTNKMARELAYVDWAMCDQINYN